jgi:hypothetical protein
MRTALVSVALIASCAPGALGQGMHFTGAGVFGEKQDAFGITTPLELLEAGDTFAFEVPVLGYDEAPGGVTTDGASSSLMYYAEYPEDASITFAIGSTGHAHTMGLGPHGLTYEVRDDVTTDAGLRDELVIEWWPTPNTAARHGGSVFTYSMTLSFASDEWAGVAPLASIDLARALGTSAYLADDEGVRIDIPSITLFQVPTPSGVAVLGAGFFALAPRRR